jgi:hypothetical protein
VSEATDSFIRVEGRLGAADSLAGRNEGAAMGAANAVSVFSKVRRRMDGAGDGIRTRDINLGKVALYQLSYSRLRVTSSFLLHLLASVNSLKKLRQAANIFLLKWYCFPQPPFNTSC